MNQSLPQESRTAICVCTYGRDRLLARLLSHLQGIQLGEHDPMAVEIIVVDNLPGTGETKALCQELAPSLPIKLYYAPEPLQGITHARNRAVVVSLERGADFLAFIDDDDLPQPDWLLRLLDCQAATQADLVCGSWALDAALPAWVRKAGIFHQSGKDKPRKNPSRRNGLLGSASTCNLLVSRPILERLAQQGPAFSHRFKFSGGEDKDFILRARDMGAQIAAAEASIVQRGHEPSRFTAHGIARRGFKNGCSRVMLVRCHGSRRQLMRYTGSATLKLLLSAALLPFTVPSRPLLMNNLYRLSKSAGMLYSTCTGRSINYYLNRAPSGYRSYPE